LSDIALKTDISLWFGFLALLAGLLYASVLYLGTRKKLFGSGLTALLFLFRFIVVTVIALLLLSPLLKSTTYYQEKPLLVMAMDNSSSMAMKDTDTARISSQWSALQEQLSNKFRIASYSFGEELSAQEALTFDKRTTNIYAALSGINQIHNDQETAALIMVSDGIYNQGIDPAYAPVDPDLRMITVGTGSDVPEKDIRINRVRYNDVVFSGNEFPMEIHVRATKAAGEQTSLVLKRNGKQLATEQISIDNDNFSERYMFYQQAEGEGMQGYTLEVNTLSGERNTENNVRNIYIDIIDEQAKVLMLAHSPHPDLFAMKAAVENKPQYKVTTSLLSAFEGQLQDYDLVVMHQLPSGERKSADLLANIFKQEIPVLFVVGGQTDLRMFNSIDAGMDIEPSAQQFNNALPAINESFSLFTLSPRVQNWLNQCPPLRVPFGDYNTVPTMNTLLYQKIDDYTSSMPLITLSGNYTQKTGVIAGTGLWKWRLRDYVLNKNHLSYDEWFYAMVRYMSISQDRDFFRVFAESKYSGHQEVTMSAELYNASYERVNEPEAALVLINGKGESFNYLFDKEDDSYMLNMGYLPEGSYRYEASVNFSGEEYRKEGAFAVTATKREAQNTVANFDLLKKLAAKQNGFFVRDSLMSSVSDSLMQEDRYQPVQYEETRYRSILDMYWVLALIFLLLAAEWFLRKYYGGY
jgi:hypothetical protein